MLHAVASFAGWIFLIAWALLSGALFAALRHAGARMSAELWTRLVLWSVPSWLVMILFVHLSFWLAGVPLVWWQASNVEKRVSPAYAGPSGAGRTLLQFRAWFMWPYCNYEDAVDGLRGGDPAQSGWALETRGLRSEQRIFKWSALRNPFNNLRYVPLLRPRFRPAWISAVGTGDEPPDGQAGWAYVSMGVYTCLWIKTPHRWIQIGWKIRASDAHGIDPGDTRLPRADFGTQLQQVH
jgi:hypothetical protein